MYDAGENFPVNLDEVWMLAYERKDHAVRDLKNNFVQLPDIQSLLKNGERLTINELELDYDYKVVIEEVKE